MVAPKEDGALLTTALVAITDATAQLPLAAADAPQLVKYSSTVPLLVATSDDAFDVPLFRGGDAARDECRAIGVSRCDIAGMSVFSLHALQHADGSEPIALGITRECVAPLQKTALRLLGLAPLPDTDWREG